MTAKYIPLRRTKKETTEAINRYARRHNMFPRSVRNSTMSHFAAMLEDDVRRDAISLGVARSQFAARYPDTRKAGPMHVSNWIK